MHNCGDEKGLRCCGRTFWSCCFTSITFLVLFETKADFGRLAEWPKATRTLTLSLARSTRCDSQRRKVFLSHTDGDCT